jgi:hypothetical protein
MHIRDTKQFLDDVDEVKVFLGLKSRTKAVMGSIRIVRVLIEQIVSIQNQIDKDKKELNSILQKINPALSDRERDELAEVIVRGFYHEQSNAIKKLTNDKEYINKLTLQQISNYVSEDREVN